MNKKIKEVWSDIDGYEGLYQISNYGRVKSLKRKTYRENRYGHTFLNHNEKILKNNTRKDGYVNTTLYKDGKAKSYAIHRLVAQHFVINPNNYKEINHKDENKTNNFAGNLEWCTRTYNNRYSKSKKVNQYDLKGNYIKTWDSIKEAAEANNAILGNISNCCKEKAKKTAGYIWRYAS